MPQPKSSRSSSSRSSSSRARKPAPATRKPAAATKKPAAATRKPAAATKKPAAATKKPAAAKRAATKRATASKPASSKPATTRAAPRPPAAAASPEDALRANVAALRDALRKGVVLTADGVKAAMDDAVERGRLTRKDATELTQSLLSAGRSQADGLRSDLEQLLGRGRASAAHSGDRVLREVDRARRRVGVGPSFPISLYDQLNAAQIQGRLNDLTPAQLRKVRDYERRHDNRKSVLGAIEKKLA